jgi:hypothetical protein
VTLAERVSIGPLALDFLLGKTCYVTLAEHISFQHLALGRPIWQVPYVT